jgi:hypothetical protein
MLMISMLCVKEELALTCRALCHPHAMPAYKQMQLTHASTAEHPRCVLLESNASDARV